MYIFIAICLFVGLCYGFYKKPEVVKDKFIDFDNLDATFAVLLAFAYSLMWIFSIPITIICYVFYRLGKFLFKN